jgi:predicted hotdog family 3-hydroxylacyl-ACP dehydratase
MQFMEGIGKNELMALVPHKGRMFLLSRIIRWDCAARTLTAEYDVGEDCLFYDPVLRGAPSWVSFEFMAQGAAALSGLRGRGAEPKPGVILSVSNLRLLREVLPAGETIRIEVREECRDDAVCAFAGEVFLEDTPAASAQFTVMEAGADFCLQDQP